MDGSVRYDQTGPPIGGTISLSSEVTAEPKMKTETNKRQLL
jgi:hypothetical protein